MIAVSPARDGRAGESLEIAPEPHQRRALAVARSPPRPRSPGRSRTRTSGSRPAAAGPRLLDDGGDELGARDAAEQCHRRLVIAHLGLKRGAVCAAHVGRIRRRSHRTVQRRRRARSRERTGCDRRRRAAPRSFVRPRAPRPRCPSPRSMRARARERARQPDCRIRCTRPRRRARRRRSPPKTSSAASTMSSVSGRGMSTAGETSSGRPQNSRRPVMYADGSRAGTTGNGRTVAITEPGRLGLVARGQIAGGVPAEHVLGEHAGAGRRFRCADSRFAQGPARGCDSLVDGGHGGQVGGLASGKGRACASRWRPNAG